MSYFAKETADSMRSYLEKGMPRYMDILREMIGINSFTLNPAGVNRLGDYTAGVFRDLGFADERVQSVNPSYGKHLILSRPGRSPIVIGCVSHLDTVFSPEEEERNNFRWRVDGDRIYGPGTEDIKGGTVVILMTLEALKHAAPEVFDGVTWSILMDASEETESVDFGDLCRRLVGSNSFGCLIFEAGRMRDNIFSVVTSRKGRAEIKITAEGKGAHSGVSHKNGASAIAQLADVIGRIEAVTDYKHELTVNVGRVAGGSQINRVPHFAEAHAEMRAFSPAVFDKALADIMALDGYSSVKSADGGFACRTAVELVRKVPAWPDNPASEKLHSFWESAGRLLGLTVNLEKRGGLSDGNYFWDYMPTIDGLGPAGGNPHCSQHSDDGTKEQEYAVKSSFVPKAVLNAMAIIRMIGS
ncbi:MAG TPA: M20/M25/M40 family metallo-hydrolase [Spirochaetota bacterium]|nr:M20/M25/M40 family metallo-hydrolase [Spirochaetota bacterium]HPC41897.1 M20/M25/M40 family metallo-hydrolase [Spirochaetota bacterium]HPL17173.1 M20/M25/M40 family metallo-hydrolase [Spirochaetota bacterium]HQF09608.1 M20/M25/M40 family metallo-hydrolase [Spirochaetota bacterium]HQH98322.1 M20/M25/M40 family metallo-hydrolase [Spirochaetota bacterium]